MKQTIIGTLIGLAALWWALRGLDMSAILQSLAPASPFWIMVSLLTVVTVAMVKAARWGALYGTTGPRLSFRELFSVLVAAQMVNIIIPLRVGELTRVGLMKQAGQPGAATISTIVVEKGLDLVAVGLVGVALAILAAAPEWLRHSAAGILLIGLILMVGLGLMWRLRDELQQWLARLLKLAAWLPEQGRRRVLNITGTMLDTLSALTNLESLSIIIFWTLLAWLLPILTIATIFWAFNLPLSIAAAGVMMLALTFSYLVPTLPGRVGVRQATAVLLLSQYGIAQTTATGFGIALNIVTIMPLLLLGGLAVWPRSVSMIDLLRHKPVDGAIGD